MATQLRRKLIDLARKYSRPMSSAPNHGTNAVQGMDGPMRVADHAAYSSDYQELPIEQWEQFRETVEAMGGEHEEVFNLLWCLGLDQQGGSRAHGLRA